MSMRTQITDSMKTQENLRSLRRQLNDMNRTHELSVRSHLRKMLSRKITVRDVMPPPPSKAATKKAATGKKTYLVGGTKAQQSRIKGKQSEHRTIADRGSEIDEPARTEGQ